MAAPDLIEPIIGWRLWLAMALRERAIYRLYSPRMTGNAPWPKGKALKSRCKASSHRRPRAQCGCGIYAHKDQPDLRELASQVCAPNYGHGYTVVVGEISLWGKVIEHERGYRAEYGYPRRLMPILRQPWPGPRETGGLGVFIHQSLRAYGVPVEIMCLDISLRPPLWDPLSSCERCLAGRSEGSAAEGLA